MPSIRPRLWLPILLLGGLAAVTAGCGRRDGNRVGTIPARAVAPSGPATPAPLYDASTDPTADESTAAALAAPLPQHTTPAPYVRLKAPDPFGNRWPLTAPVPDDGRELLGPDSN